MSAIRAWVRILTARLASRRILPSRRRGRHAAIPPHPLFGLPQSTPPEGLWRVVAGGEITALRGGVTVRAHRPVNGRRLGTQPRTTMPRRGADGGPWAPEPMPSLAPDPSMWLLDCGWERITAAGAPTGPRVCAGRDVVNLADPPGADMQQQVWAAICAHRAPVQVPAVTA